MKQLLMLGLLFSTSANASSYKCDLFKELPKKISAKHAHDSEKYKAVYTDLYQDFDISVKKICDYLKKCEKGDMEVRRTYAETRFGKDSVEKMEKLKAQFGYDGLDYYLFDDHELNQMGNLKITHRYRKADRIYYLNEMKVVAYLDQVGEEGVLHRLNGECDVSEIVSFSSLTNINNAIRMKVTQPYCTTAQNKGPTFKHTEEDLQSMGAFFLSNDGVEDQMEAQELCEDWVPMPEPVGLVIDTSQPLAHEVKKTKSKKHSKQSPVAKSKKKKKKKNQ